jgi:hypothetical protein
LIIFCRLAIPTVPGIDLIIRGDQARDRGLRVDDAAPSSADDEARLAVLWLASVRARLAALVAAARAVDATCWLGLRIFLGGENINSFDPLLTSGGAAYSAKPLLPLLDPPVELAAS